MSPEGEGGQLAVSAVAAKAYTYDAFLSYSHADRAVAVGIQQGLHRIGRRAGQLHALRVFRDSTDLSANPNLWGKVTEAMDQSRYLIVVLSPRAARSEWVNNEVGYWLERRGPDNILLVLAEGQLRWDEATQRFNPDAGDVTVPVFAEPKSLPNEPLYVDVSTDAPWDPHTQGFRDKLTDLAAPIHGKTKYELASEDVREQRRFRRLRNAAIVGLAVLAVFATAAARLAWVQRGEAIAQRREAIAQRNQAIASQLTAQARSILIDVGSGSDERALQQILAAQAIADRPDEAALLDAAAARRDLVKIINAGVSVTGVAMSPDGRRIVAISMTDQSVAQVGSTLVHQWDLATGQPVGEPIEARDYEGPLGDPLVTISPDGTKVLRIEGAGGDEMLLYDWRETQQPVAPPIIAHQGRVLSAAFSPDGSRIVSAGRDKTLKVWDTVTGEQVGPTVTGHADYVGSVAYSFDGKLIVSGGGDSTVQLWDARSLAPVGYAMKGHTGAVTIVAFSPDGTKVASVSPYEIDQSKSVRVWDVSTQTEIASPTTGHPGQVQAVAFTPDSQHIITGGSDQTVRISSIPPSEQFGRPLWGGVRFDSLVFSPTDARLLISGDEVGMIRLWDPQNFKEIEVDPWMPGPTGPVFAAVAPDGRRIASAAADGTVSLWDIRDIRDHQQVGSPIRGHEGVVWAIAFSPDGTRLVTGGQDGTLRLWDTTILKPVGGPLRGHDRDVYAVAFSPDGNRVVSGGRDGTVRLWDVSDAASGGQISETIIGRHVTGRVATTAWSVSFSPDGQQIVSAGRDNIRLWNATTREQVGEPIPAVGRVDAMAISFSPDGRYIVSGGYVDNMVRIWDPSTRQQIGPPLPGHIDSVNSVAFSPDGRTIGSASYDGTIRIWPGPPQWRDALCSKLTTNMNETQWRDWIDPNIEYHNDLCPGLPVAPG